MSQLFTQTSPYQIPEAPDRPAAQATPVETLPITVATFYRFVALPDHEALQQWLLSRASQLDLKGSILLAQEGINATISGPEADLQAFLADLQSDPRLAQLEIKYSFAEIHPFQRFKVRLKQEIVKFEQPQADPNQQVGTYLDPQAWNELLQAEDVLLIDTRNKYETRIGSFAGAIDPQIQNFREFPDYVKAHLDPARHKRVAMFCTGGIRCEKASSWMLQEGFEEVYHLKGGILKYLEEVPPDQSQWQGQCYVFDERIAVAHGLSYGDYEMCWGCGEAVGPQDRESEAFERGVSCPACRDQRSESQLERSRQSWAQRETEAQKLR